jgi:hypothetical protein
LRLCVPSLLQNSHIAHYSKFPGVFHGLIRARRCRGRGGLLLKRVILSNNATLATPGIAPHVPRFQAEMAARSANVGFTLEGLEDRGFIVSDSYDDWLDGDLSSDFADAFLAPVLDAQSAGGRAGDPEETRKLLRSHWRNEIVRTGE